MRELLGDEGKAKLEDYLRAQSVHSFIDTIAARTYASAQPITLAQADQLFTVALAHGGRGRRAGESKSDRADCAARRPARRLFASSRITRTWCSTRSGMPPLGSWRARLAATRCASCSAPSTRRGSRPSGSRERDRSSIKAAGTAK